MRRILSRARHLLLGVILTSSTICLAQGAGSPAGLQNTGDLAAVARNAKLHKTAPPKKAFTGDDIEETDGPLPRLNLSGEDNTGYVVSAIVRYSESHSAKETEEAVHNWFDRYDQALASVIQDNLDLMNERNAGSSNGNEPCQQNPTSGRCENLQATDRGAPPDWSTRKRKSEKLIGQLQNSLAKVRRGMKQNKLGYDWFKVRTADGQGSF